MVTILKRSKTYLRSLKFRIFILILLLGTIPIIVLQAIFMNMIEDSIISTRLQNVNSQFSVLTSYFSQELDEELDDYENFSVLVEGMLGTSIQRIQIVDRDFEIILDSYYINTGKLCISQDVNQCFNGTNSAYADEENQCLILVQPITSTDETGESQVEYVIFATASISDIYSALSAIQIKILAIMVIVIILIIFVALWLSYILVKPFEKVNSAIKQVENGHMTEEIHLSGYSEVEDISNSFNMMTAKINQLEESRQEFVSNVSHELKTPLTSMKVLSDSILSSEDVPVEIYRDFMESLSTEIDRENTIISDLLTLVKLDREDAGLNITSVSINDLLEYTLKMIMPLAEEKNIELVMESYRPVSAEVDEVKLSMAVSNLVENAVKYNNPEGWVHVSLNSDQTFFYIKIQDNGFGIPEESKERVFDRFYRVDKARDRAAGGTGLGLAITKSIIVAHGGEIKLYSKEGEGTTFSIQIPLTHVVRRNK